MNEVATIRTYTHRVKLSKSVHVRLDDFLNQLTLLWNCALEERINAYQKCDVSVGYFGAEGQQDSLKLIRRDDEWFSGFHASSQRSILRRLHKAFENFYRRCKNGEKPGFPKFKSGRRKVRSFETEQFTIKTKNKWHSVSVKGIGKFRFKGELQGRVKMIRIVKTPRRVNIQLVTELPAGNGVVDEREPIGIDLGISSVVALSNGIAALGAKPDTGKKKHLQRKVARAKTGSKSRKKAVLQLSKECQRLKERRHGELHELSSRIIREHSSNLAVEDLKIRNMTKKGNRKSKKGLNRSMLEQKWGGLMLMLSYKAESAGGMLLKVPPHYTSQTCSSCFQKREVKLKLHERVFRCEHCGHEEDRDVNAAKNILRAGLSGGLAGRAVVLGRVESQDSSSKRAIRPTSGGRLTVQNSIQWSGYHCI